MEIDPKEAVAAFSVLTRRHHRDEKGRLRTESFSSEGKPLPPEPMPAAVSMLAHQSYGSAIPPNIYSDKRKGPDAGNGGLGSLGNDSVAVHPKYRKINDRTGEPNLLVIFPELYLHHRL